MTATQTLAIIRFFSDKGALRRPFQTFQKHAAEISILIATVYHSLFNINERLFNVHLCPGIFTAVGNRR